jgi:hypothetical protein
MNDEGRRQAPLAQTQVALERSSRPRHTRHIAAPQVVRVSVGTLRKVRRLVDPDLPPDEREQLCAYLEPELDHLISVAEAAAWKL